MIRLHVALIALLGLATGLAGEGLRPCVAADGPDWLRDVEDGKKRARGSGQDLLILFTGHGWCAQCEVMDREVFRQAEFVRSTSGDFVFVELDFNFGDSPLEQARESRYRELQKTYLVRGFPTLVLADADGVPYAMITGYASGAGVVRILESLRVARAARAERDRHFAHAESSRGIERAEYLDRGIRSVAALLESVENRGDDPVLVFYRRQVESLMASDDSDEARVRRHYEARARSRDEWMARESLFDKLKVFDANRDYRGAIAHIGQVLEGIRDPDVQWRLEWSRQIYLERAGQHDQALQNARRLLHGSDVAIDGRTREDLLDREAFNLFRLGRVDEGLAHYDRRIAEAGGDAEKRRGLLGWKAQMILNCNRPADAIETWEAYREATEPGTFDWLTATAILARQYRAAGQFARALVLVGEYLERDHDPWIALNAADCHIALGEFAQARAVVDQVQAAIAPLRQSERLSDREQVGRIDKRMAGLRGRLDAAGDRKQQPDDPGPQIGDR